MVGAANHHRPPQADVVGVDPTFAVGEPRAPPCRPLRPGWLPTAGPSPGVCGPPGYHATVRAWQEAHHATTVNPNQRWPPSWCSPTKSHRLPPHPGIDTGVSRHDLCAAHCAGCRMIRGGLGQCVRTERRTARRRVELGPPNEKLGVRERRSSRCSPHVSSPQGTLQRAPPSIPHPRRPRRSQHPGPGHRHRLRVRACAPVSPSRWRACWARNAGPASATAARIAPRPVSADPLRVDNRSSPPRIPGCGVAWQPCHGPGQQERGVPRTRRPHQPPPRVAVQGTSPAPGTLVNQVIAPSSPRTTMVT